MTLRSLIRSILTAVLCISVLGYLSFQLFRSKGTGMEVEVVEYVTQRDVAEINGYIFREETVIYNGYTGFINYQVQNNQKIGINALIANVFSNDANTVVKQEIDEINKKIDILSRSIIDTSYISAGTSRIDSDIQKLYVELLDGLSNKNAARVPVNRDEILIQLNRRQMLTARASTNFAEQVEELTARRDKLLGGTVIEGMNFLGGNAIYAPSSGTFYNNLDGFEEVFDPELIGVMSIGEFQELLTSKPDGEILDNSIGKLTPNYEWHTVCLIDKADASIFELNRQYELIFPYSGDAKIKCVLERKAVQTDNDYVLLAFKSLMVPSYFDFSRKQPVKIVLSEVSGLKVPHTALRMVDNTLGIFVLSGNTVRFKLVKEEDKLWENHNYYIISEGKFGENEVDSYGRLKLYDQVITSGKDVYDGMVIN